jgi:chitinase
MRVLVLLRARKVEAILSVLAVLIAGCSSGNPSGGSGGTGGSGGIGGSGGSQSYRVVGYFPQWGIYEPTPYYVKNIVTSGSAAKLTHVIYAFAGFANNQCASSDPGADYKDVFAAGDAVNGQADSGAAGVLAGNFNQLKELKAAYPNLKILVSINGSSRTAPNAFSNAATPVNLNAFVTSCVNMYIQGNFAPGITQPGIFDGIDIDWEFPSSSSDQTNFIAMLQEFRTQLNAINPSLELTNATPAGSWGWQYMDLTDAQKSLDFFNLMTYDFDAPWSDTTGFVAPLYQAALDPSATNNANAAVEAYTTQLGIPASKINLGMPFYSYDWTGVATANNGLFEPGTPDQNSYEYNYVSTLTGYQAYRDSTTQEPWLFNAATGTFFTYDDPTSLAFKTDYAVKNQLGGIMFWELSGDTATGDELNAITTELKK